MLPVFVGTNYWSLNGVNVFCANLTRGLRERGFDARLLLTEQYTARVTLPPNLMTLPAAFPVAYLPAPYDATWATRWGRLIRFLERHGPCVVIPNADYRNSCVLPYLSHRVGIVGVAHSDDPLHYDHVSRLGATWNRVVTVSETIRDRVSRRMPDLAARTVTIPIGVDVPAQIAARNAGPLRGIYHGVISNRQKRIADLVRLLDECVARKVPFHLTVAGTGPDEAAFQAALAPHVAAGRAAFVGLQPHEAIGALLDEADVFVMTSEFEGMPHALLEAMAHGCVPVMTAIASGSPEVVRDGENGCLAPVGDVAVMGAHLDRLHRHRPRLAEMSAAARAAIAGSRYTHAAMIDAWASLLAQVEHEARVGAATRGRGHCVLPPAELDGVSIFPIGREVIPGVGEFPVTEYRDFRIESRLGIAGTALRTLRALRRAARTIIVFPHVSLPWWRIRHEGVRLRIFLLGYVPSPIKRAARALLRRLLAQPAAPAKATSAADVAPP